MEHQTKQKAVQHEIIELLKKYNALSRDQLYALFGKEGSGRYVGRALKTLEKERLLYINQVTKIAAPNEAAYAVRDKGTVKAFWALLGIMGHKKVEQHFLAAKEEYPVRIIFVGDGEMFDILYVPEEDIGLTNHLFARRRIEGCGHIVVVESPLRIPEIKVPDAIGFCTVNEEGEVEYYKKNE